MSQRQPFRRRTALGGATASAEVSKGGAPLHNFASNDYLGLSQRPEVTEAMLKAAGEHGAASGGSPYMCGYSEPHQQLEQELAELTGRDKALLFSSGYMANIGTVTSLCDASSHICADRNVHASLIDAILLSRARFSRHRHLDAAALGKALRRAAARPTLALAEGMYSMDGDSPPLAECAEACAEHGATFMLDDAHGFGTLSAAGSVAQAGLGQEQVPLMTATLSKAVGASGAFVAGRQELINKVAQRARTLIYSTSPAPAMVAAATAALRLCAGKAGDQARAALSEVTELFTSHATSRKVPLMGNKNSPIKLVPMSSREEAERVSKALEQQGFWVPAIRYPTVPQGKERLRVSLSAGHPHDVVKELIDAIAAQI